MTLDLTSGPTVGVEFLGSLDPALPSIPASFDTTSVAQRFEREWATPVARCELLRVRYEPAVRCVTTYRLELPQRAAGDAVGVIDLTPSGATCRDYVEDPSLPGLRVATDPSRASDLLGPLGSRVQAVSYHPGERAVLRYQVGPGSASHPLFGKVLADGAGILAVTLATIGGAARVDESLPSVPALVRVVDEHGLVVARPMAGEPLHAWVLDGTRPRDQRRDAFRLAGTALARLHGAGLETPTTVTAAGDAGALRTYLAAARQVDGALATRMEAAIARAGATAAACTIDDEATVSSHGALRTDQIVLSRGRPGLLDLDGYCSAHPARDLGNLLAYLRWRSLRNPQHQAAAGQARAAFLDGYGAGAALPAATDVAVFEAISLLKIAGRRFRSLAVDEWPLVPALLDAADSLLASGAQQ